MLVFKWKEILKSYKSVSSMAHLRVTLSSFGELSNATITHLAEQIFRDNFYGAVTKVTVKSIQRVRVGP
ncbi:hypothetical protein INR49_023964 [Caranx melampygus]|nr:hypothetical protein INR49_023964 [Caranx melampygus]